MAAPSVPANPALVTRRVVTARDAEGRSVIASDGPSPVNVAVLHPDFVINELWRSDVPADNLAAGEPVSGTDLEPGAGGNVLKIVHLPPDSEYLGAMDPAAAFAELGESGAAAATAHDNSPHPMMHQTNTVDYVIILSGEVHVVLDRQETVVRAGDVVVQRGTNHAWSNRSNAPCVFAAVLNAAQPIAQLS
ncbi:MULTISPECIES: cupin domain-containing protein [unclassified Sphingomonas]|uniref:cupin domain-containing protein n=1 Tax=unclassified Sphingomonas TaxID=196159 RepID=UPI00092CB647|nr:MULTISPECIES: cupin domain-containing protein [unclassified Sphingomonas]MBN8846617.1 cupin domain-containing protein [Sphingomonas sp.]OJV27442.1 MAG: hypothetical protein BGO24_00970 [Sphingomonas sp. 67-36]